MQKLVLIPPPAIAFALIGLAFGIDRLLPNLPHLGLPGLGLVLMAAGISLGAAALANFFRQRTTFVPHGEPSSLVVRGDYQWTRNPMYLGLCTIVLGVALYFGMLPLFLVPPAMFVLIDRVYIPYEEAKLLKLFGAPYEEFLGKVARWL
jgi:protein-S-isoprenylcysteine O-methyltransferase Ste14